jgi:hypothetical protein
MKMNDDLTLGRLLGRREAFNVVAARCSAADAAILRELREKKLYLNHAEDWDEFCTQHLHTTKETANRLIRHLDEFGPTYFEVAQLTRISPATYRAIAPSIRDQALHHNGDVIALIPENAEKVAAAVAELRKTVTPPAPAPKASSLETRCRELIVELKTAENTEELRGMVFYLRAQLVEIATSLR